MKSATKILHLCSGLIALFTVVGCLSVTIPDSEWCGDLGQDGAACFHTLSVAERDIAKPSWDVEREGMICTQSATFASWKGIIEKLCHESSDCDYQKVSDFLEKASTLKRKP